MIGPRSLRTSRRRLGPVLEATLPQTTIVRRPAPGTGTSRFAVIASFGRRPVPSRSIVELAHELRRCGFAVVIVRSSPGNEPWTDTSALDASVGYVQRPNAGYDFGSWAAAMELFPGALAYDQVLLTNDSIVGPFGGLDVLLDDLATTTADVWAATSTLQLGPHLQSFFVGYRRGVLREPALRDFWMGIREHGTKREIIEEHEIGLSRVLQAEGYSATAAIPSELVVGDGDNPTIDGWDRLLDAGFPFVKRELLTTDRFERERTAIVHRVRDMYGVDPEDWIEDVVSE